MMHPAMRTKDAIHSELAAEQAKLASLDRTREQARAKIEALRSELAVATATPAFDLPFSSAASSHAPDTPSDKVKLFRSLFRGRADVFPVRFVSEKTGNPGYALACSNKWEPRLCLLKSGGKCGDCAVCYVRCALTTDTSAPCFATPAISDNDARQFGIDAYVYLYPLISMDVTRRVSTNVEAGKKPGLRLAGAFQHFRKFPTAEFREVVRPNFDMPYWLAWLDVSKEPNLNTLCTARGPKQSAAREHPLELPYP